jgi:hypothetical protein
MTTRPSAFLAVSMVELFEEIFGRDIRIEANCVC